MTGIQVGPHELRAYANHLAQAATTIQCIIATTGQEIDRSQAHFEGHRAQQLVQRFLQSQQDMMEWAATLRHFSDLLVEAADAFEQSDTTSGPDRALIRDLIRLANDLQHIWLNDPCSGSVLGANTGISLTNDYLYGLSLGSNKYDYLPYDDPYYQEAREKLGGPEADKHGDQKESPTHYKWRVQMEAHKLMWLETSWWFFDIREPLAELPPWPSEKAKWIEANPEPPY